MTALRPSGAALAAALVLSACMEGGTGGPGLTGEVWALRSIDGVAFDAPATLILQTDGSASGEGPCNRFSGPYGRADGGLQIGPLAATRRACADMAAEDRFFGALEGSFRLRLNDPPGTLTLRRADGRTLVFAVAG